MKFTLATGNGIALAPTSSTYMIPIRIENLNVISSAASTGAGIYAGGSGASYNGDDLEINNVTIYGFAQCLSSNGYGNGFIGDMQCYGSPQSTGKYLVDLAPGSANSWKVEKLWGNCIPGGDGASTAAGMLRIQSGFGNSVFVGDIGGCNSVVTLGNDALRPYPSAKVDIYIGDTEGITGPLVQVGIQGEAAVHWLDFQGAIDNTTSSPFVMEISSILTLYNPPNQSYAIFPLVTRGQDTSLTIVGGSFGTNSGWDNLGTQVKDYAGEQYVGNTPFTEVNDNSTPGPTQYDRGRCFFVATRASASGEDQLVCHYRSKPNTFASTGNLLNSITSITAGSGLTVAGSGPGAVTIALNGSSPPNTSNANYAQLDASNAFIGNQSIAGALDVQGTATVADNLTAGTLSIGGDAPMSHAPRMTFSGFVAGNLNSTSAGQADNLAGIFTPDQNIVITRLDASAQSMEGSCAIDPILKIVDSTNGNAVLYSLNLASGQTIFTSGPIGVSASGEHTLALEALPGSGCTMTASSSGTQSIGGAKPITLLRLPAPGPLGLTLTPNLSNVTINVQYRME